MRALFTIRERKDAAADATGFTRALASDEEGWQLGFASGRPALLQH